MEQSQNNFESKMNELIKINQYLQSGNLSLEDSLIKFKEGVKIYNELQEQLNQVKNQVTNIIDENENSQPFIPQNGNNNLGEGIDITGDDLPY